MHKQCYDNGYSVSQEILDILDAEEAIRIAKEESKEEAFAYDMLLLINDEKEVQL